MPSLLKFYSLLTPYSNSVGLDTSLVFKSCVFLLVSVHLCVGVVVWVGGWKGGIFFLCNIIGLELMYVYSPRAAKS